MENGESPSVETALYHISLHGEILLLEEKFGDVTNRRRIRLLATKVWEELSVLRLQVEMHRAELRRVREELAAARTPNCEVSDEKGH